MDDEHDDNKFRNGSLDDGNSKNGNMDEECMEIDEWTKEIINMKDG